MNLVATFMTHKQFPFTQALPVIYSCDLSAQQERRIERRLLTEQHKNTKADLSMTDFFFMTQQSPAGHGLLIIQDSRSYSDTPRSVGLLWTSDRPVEETSTK
jgi:hypothetical protein